MNDKLIRSAKKFRTMLSRAFGAALFLLLLFSGRLEMPVYMDHLCRIIGLIFVTIALAGRLWAALYLSGNKSKRLISEGPYSIVRNPLYIFSFTGAVGFGIGSCSLLCLGILIAVFLLYYSFVVKAEEERLRSIHTEDFDRYAGSVPRFIPRFSLYYSSQEYTVN